MPLIRIICLFIGFSIPALGWSQDSCLRVNEPLRFTQKQLIAPALLLGSGLLCSGQIKYNVADFRQQHLPDFHSSADNVLSVAPIFVVYGLDLIGIPAKNDFWNRSVILFKGELMTLGLGYALKYATHVQRPDESDFHSFPSNHTAQAFLAATFISQEYKNQFPWMPYAAYTLASSVGLLRIANNRHYLSDVLVGASIGLLSQKIAYWTHQYKWNRAKKKTEVFKF